MFNIDNCGKIFANYLIKKYDLNRIREVCDKMYPDRYDIQVDIDSEHFADYLNSNSIDRSDKLLGFRSAISYNLILYYPEVTIRNHQRKEHLIKDLYVKLPITFHSYGAVIKRTYGIRGSLTLEEMKRGYSHSHLQSGHFTSFKSFCLGGGPLRLKMYDYNFDNNIPSSKLELQYIFTLLNDYLQWESKSGVPYILFEYVGKTTFTESVDDSLIENIFKRIRIPSIRYTLKNNFINVIIDDKFEKDLHVELLKYYSTSSLYCFKDSSGRYLKNNPSQINDQLLELEGINLFKFRGESVKFKILNVDTTQDYQYNAVNPYVTKKIAKLLSYELTKKYIRDCRVRQENTGEYSKEGVESDSIPVL